VERQRPAVNEQAPGVSHAAVCGQEQRNSGGRADAALASPRVHPLPGAAAAAPQFVWENAAQTRAGSVAVADSCWSPKRRVARRQANHYINTRAGEREHLLKCWLFRAGLVYST
jgi:hypothetical protein